MPFIGNTLVHSMLGGPIIAGETLSRFFAIHVFLVPGMLIAFVGVHVLMVLKLGVNEWPMPGRIVKRATYLQEYHELTKKDGVPFVPDAFRKDFVFSGMIILALVLCAAFFGPFGPSGQPDPTVVQAVPKPDYFFLWAYAALALLPPQMETPLLIIGPVMAVGFLIALPLISGTGEKSWRRRPVAVLSVLLIIIALAAFTQLGTYAPWSPVMDAWSSAPVPSNLLKGRTALERQGAVVFQDKQCRNCHALGGEGGQRGPALDTVATRLTGDQLIRQVLQGRGNMPAYNNNLSPPETTALVAFLKSLHPSDQKPAEDASLANVAPEKR
jgi:ubiquinol-cytochrome c reductase cytochrome b subunit